MVSRVFVFILLGKEVIQHLSLLLFFVSSPRVCTLLFFCLSKVCLSKQKLRYWSSSTKVTVCTAISARGFIWAYFFTGIRWLLSEYVVLVRFVRPVMSSCRSLQRCSGKNSLLSRSRYLTLANSFLNNIWSIVCIPISKMHCFN